ncbi:MAG: DUF192 domain-containing protein [Gammaproteobacteria bacterium]
MANVLTLGRAADEQPLVHRVRHAEHWRERLTGLLGRRGLTHSEGLWIKPCNSIHTFGMRFDIDVLFLDDEQRIVRAVTALKPWRCALARASSVVELAAGSIDRLELQIGERLHLTPASPSTNYEESLA